MNISYFVFYLMETGRQIVRKIGFNEEHQPKKSTCKFEKG